MKKLQTLLAVALCGAFFTMVASASAQSGKQGYGTVVRVAGQASYSLGDNNWHPLQAGKYLPVGATVRTGDNGVVDIVLGKSVPMPQVQGQPSILAVAPDAAVRGIIGYAPSVQQNIIRLTPNTTLAIDKLTIIDTGADAVSDTELNLKQGKIFASVKKLSGASQYLVKLPNGIAGVRGTQFSISADGAVAVYESTGGGVVLSLTLPDGTTKTYVISAGQMLDQTTGQPTSIPPSLINTLQDVFTAVKSISGDALYFSADHTQIYISPTTGAPSAPR